MTLKKSHTTFLVILGAFLFAYLSSRSSGKEGEVKDKPQTEAKEPAQEENPAVEQEQPAGANNQANFAPSYIPRIVPPGTRPRVGPTPGIIGEPINVDPEYNPYAGLTEMMKQRQQQQGNNPPPDNSQRNLYFETLSNQLKELQGQGNAVIEQDGPVEQQPGPTSVPGVMPTGGLPNGAPLQQIERPDDNLLAPVDPAYNNEVVDESGSDVSEEDVQKLIGYDDAELDEELDRLEEEGLLD